MTTHVIILNQRSLSVPWCSGFLLGVSHIGMWCPYDWPQLLRIGTITYILRINLTCQLGQHGPRSQTHQRKTIRQNAPVSRRLSPRNQPRHGILENVQDLSNQGLLSQSFPASNTDTFYYFNTPLFLICKNGIINCSVLCMLYTVVYAWII